MSIQVPDELSSQLGALMREQKASRLGFYPDGNPNAAIAAAPQPQIEVTDEMCDRVRENALLSGDYESGTASAETWLTAWQSELGPTLGMTAWREPTEEECVKMCSILTDWEVRRNNGFSLSPQGITQAQEAHGRAMFEAVREVMGGAE